MIRFKGALAATVALLAVSIQAEPLKLDLPEDARTSLDITIYKQGFAVVRDTRLGVFPRGLLELEFKGAPRLIQPESVVVRGVGVDVIEQNYRYDLLNKESLLSRFIGRKIKYSRNVMQDGTLEKVLREGRLLSVNPEVVQFGDEVEISPEGTISLAYLPDDLKAQPTLIWLLDNKTDGDHDITTTYLTRGFSWHAEYALMLGAGEEGELSAWVSLENTSGHSYVDATVALVAGQVNRVDSIARQRLPTARSNMMAAEAAMPAEPLAAYYLYRVPGRTTLADKARKQVRLLTEKRVLARQRFEVTGAAMQHQESSRRVPVNHVVDLENNTGEPLAAGVVRVYSDSSERLLGEDRLRETPRGDTAHIRLGTAFDLVATRRQTAYRKPSQREVVVSYEIAVDNRGGDDAEVDVIESFDTARKLLKERPAGEDRDAGTRRWRLDVPGGEQRKVEYTVHLTW